MPAVDGRHVRVVSHIAAYITMHVYSIPPSLFDSLSLRDNISRQYSRQPSPSPSPSPLPTVTGPRACNICLASTFGDVHEQRTHFRSDWHRYNVKIRINGANPVTEQAFSELIDGAFPSSQLACLSISHHESLLRTR
jgi:hypothetical protein